MSTVAKGVQTSALNAHNKAEFAHRTSNEILSFDATHNHKVHLLAHGWGAPPPLCSTENSANCYI